MIDACNDALGLIGYDPISDIDDTGEVKAIRCKQFFWTEVKALLRRYDWNFATKRIALTLLTDTPAGGYDYTYGLPANCIKVQVVATTATDIDSSDSSSIPVSYKVEGGVILCSETTLYCKYTEFSKETGKWDSGFRQVFGAMLAAKLAWSLKKSQADMQAMLKLAAAFLQTAMSVDAGESGDVPAYTRSSWVEKRK